MVAIAVTLIVMVGLYLIKPTHITIHHISEANVTNTINSHAKQEIVENLPEFTPFDPSAEPKDPKEVSFAETLQGLSSIMMDFSRSDKGDK